MAGQFACEACGKNYRWKPELAGKRAKCGCGAVFACPAEEPTDDDDGLLDLAPEPSPAPSRSPVTARAAVMNTPGPAPTFNRTLAYRAAQQDQDAGTTFGFDLTLKDFYVPIVLIVLGTVFRFVYYMHLPPSHSHHRGLPAPSTGVMVGAVAIVVAVGLFIDLVLTFIAILISTKVADMSFGHPLTAILKIIAIATVVPIIRDLSHLVLGGITIGYGLYFGWGISFLTYAVMFMALFDLDWSEARICSAIVWVLNIVAGVVFAVLLVHFHP